MYVANKFKYIQTEICSQVACMAKQIKYLATIRMFSFNNKSFVGLSGYSNELKLKLETSYKEIS